MAAVQSAIDKVAGKIVRVQISDGRRIVGRLQCVDKTKALFIENALEIVDTASTDHYKHAVFDDHLYRDKGEGETRCHKMMGGMTIPFAVVKSIKIEHGLTSKF